MTEGKIPHVRDAKRWETRPGEWPRNAGWRSGSAGPIRGRPIEIPDDDRDRQKVRDITDSPGDPGFPGDELRLETANECRLAAAPKNMDVAFSTD